MNFFRKYQLKKALTFKNWYKFLIGFVLTSYIDAMISVVRGDGSYYSSIWLNPIAMINTMIRSLSFATKLLSPFSGTLSPTPLIDFLYLVFLYVVFAIMMVVATVFVFIGFHFLSKIGKQSNSSNKKLKKKKTPISKSR